MPAQSFTEHILRLPGRQQTVSFSQRLHAGQFLTPWCYMDPDVKDFECSGPTWVYEAKGRKRNATVPLTVRRRSSQAVEYWDAVDDRRGMPTSVDVKRAHAALEGRRYVLFDSAFINSHIVEVWNRRNGFFTLMKATPESLKPAETDVLVSLNDGAKTLGQLNAELPHSAGLLRAAVMSLWRQARLQVPAGESLFGDSWTVRRCSLVRS